MHIAEVIDRALPLAKGVPAYIVEKFGETTFASLIYIVYPLYLLAPICFVFAHT